MEIKPYPTPIAGTRDTTAEPSVIWATPCPSPMSCERVPLGKARTKEEIVDLTRNHLAGRLGTPIEQVEMISVEKEWWDDDMLGCPSPPGNSPDRAYPGPISGYRILLAVEGVQYEYRSGKLWLFFCGTPLPTETK